MSGTCPGHFQLSLAAQVFERTCSSTSSRLILGLQGGEGDEGFCMLSMLVLIFLGIKSSTPNSRLFVFTKILTFSLFMCSIIVVFVILLSYCNSYLACYSSAFKDNNFALI